MSGSNRSTFCVYASAPAIEDCENEGGHLRE